MATAIRTHTEPVMTLPGRYYYDQDIFEPMLQSARLQLNIFEGLSGPHRLHHTDCEPAGKYAVIARRVKPLADLDLVLQRHEIHLAQRRVVALAF